MSKESNKSKNVGIALLIGVALFLLIGIVTVIGFIAKINKASSDGDDTENGGGSGVSTEQVERRSASDYVKDDEEMFIKYGNFKDYENAVAVIKNSMPDATTEDISKEVFEYWFTLIRYEDYADAYTFIDTDYIKNLGADYGIDDFTCDMANLRVYGEYTSGITMQAQILDGKTPYMAKGVENRYMCRITSTEDDEAGNVVYLPYYCTEDYKIIPVDISQPSVLVMLYGTADNGISEPEDALTTSEGEISDSSADTTEAGGTEATTETVD